MIATEIALWLITFTAIASGGAGAVVAGFYQWRLDERLDRMEWTLDEWRDADVELPSKHVARLLGVHVSTVTGWCRDGVLAGRKSGGQWLVRRGDVDRFRAADVPLPSMEGGQR